VAKKTKRKKGNEPHPGASQFEMPEYESPNENCPAYLRTMPIDTEAQSQNNGTADGLVTTEVATRSIEHENTQPWLDIPFTLVETHPLSLNFLTEAESLFPETNNQTLPPSQPERVPATGTSESTEPDLAYQVNDQGDIIQNELANTLNDPTLSQANWSPTTRLFLESGRRLNRTRSQTTRRSSDDNQSPASLNSFESHGGLGIFELDSNPRDDGIVWTLTRGLSDGNQSEARTIGSEFHETQRRFELENDHSINTVDSTGNSTIRFRASSRVLPAAVSGALIFWINTIRAVGELHPYPTRDYLHIGPTGQRRSSWPPVLDRSPGLIPLGVPTMAIVPSQHTKTSGVISSLKSSRAVESPIMSAHNGLPRIKALFRRGRIFARKIIARIRRNG
jgi:hypothetical protein